MALAIGTLTGDALLHLFPHALLYDFGHHENHEAFHKMSVWKGFAAMVALLAFFLSEQLINMIGSRRKQKKEEKAPVELTQPELGDVHEDAGGGGVMGGSSVVATGNDAEVSI